MEHVLVPPLLSGLLLMASAATTPDTEADPRRGGQVYQTCFACHSLEAGRHLTGPSLADLWGRKAGRAEGFDRYSAELKASDITWDEDSLNAWLADPKVLVPGTYMIFDGIKDNETRADLIAFLRYALAPDGAHKVTDRGFVPAELTIGQVPDPVRNVGPERQVTGIRHCRSTYHVRTANGEETPYWETNVRFKTDTSDRGPLPGKPVLLDAGMRGDRVSVLFASSAEIGRTIVEQCQP